MEREPLAPLPIGSVPLGEAGRVANAGPYFIAAPARLPGRVRAKRD